MVSPMAVERLRRGGGACWRYDDEVQRLVVTADGYSTSPGCGSPTWRPRICW
ncbi:hypothetical protein ACNTMW_02630 [Planosporangium sp. 12N6]|uniref:hypothetical protein n=1 Tax=Planosporangium spinosum TaxID=3402278 RepID=UPI003CF188D5